MTVCYLYNDNLREDFHSAESLEAMSDNTEPRGHGNIVGCGEVPGASVRNPARDKVMRKEADIRKACSDFRGPSGNS